MGVKIPQPSPNQTKLLKHKTQLILPPAPPPKKNIYIIKIYNKSQ